MNNGICYIVGSGDNAGIDFIPIAGDYVIAADGGFRYLEQAKIAADMVIGDFDTLGYTPDHPHAVRLSGEKDDTDTLAAVREGIKTGYKRFCLYACTGGRIEHTIANIQTLAFLSESGMTGFILGRNSVMTAVTNGTAAFPPRKDGYVSVFSFSERSTGVYLKGVKYELDNACLTNTFPLGVSNEFIGTESSFRVTNGTLLIVFPRESKWDVICPTIRDEKFYTDYT
jgi:thiamine pyrophosphokinase